MTSSLHVSLPDEMRAYVDLRTDGKKDFATPSEYVRALIRSDMEKEAQRMYVFVELLKSSEEIKNGQLLSAEEVEDEIDSMFEQWHQEEAEASKK